MGVPRVTLRDVRQQRLEDLLLELGVGEVEIEVSPDESLVEEGGDTAREVCVDDLGEAPVPADLGDVDAEDLGNEGRVDVEGEELVDDVGLGDDLHIRYWDGDSPEEAR